MRNSKKIQALADECAKEHCFLCASYRGRSDEELIYAPLFSNSENNPSIPTYILVRKDEVEFVQGFEYYDVLEGIRIRDFRKGRRIYQTLYRKFQKKNFECNEDDLEEHSLVCSLLGPYPMVSRNLLYDYLEIGERLGMKVEICHNSDDDVNGNWLYHVELREL